MPKIQITGGHDISYEVLARHHFTAKEIYDYKISHNQPIVQDYEFKVNLEALNEEDAQAQFMCYVNKLDEFSIVSHIGHIMYLMTNLSNFEGTSIEQSKSDNKVFLELDILEKLYNLKAQSSKLFLEFTHKANGKDFGDYLKLNDSDLIKVSLSSIIVSQQTKVREIISLTNPELKSLSFELDTLSDIEILKSNLLSINQRSLKALFLFTVTKALRDYLTQESNLNPSNSMLTNDMARVIYATLRFANLISLEYDTELEEINYIRSIINNNRNVNPIISTISQ